MKPGEPAGFAAVAGQRPANKRQQAVDSVAMGPGRSVSLLISPEAKKQRRSASLSQRQIGIQARRNGVIQKAGLAGRCHDGFPFGILAALAFTPLTSDGTANGKPNLRTLSNLSVGEPVGLGNMPVVLSSVAQAQPLGA